MKEFLKSSIYKIIIVFLVIAADLITKEYLYASNYTIIPFLIGTRSVAGLNTGGAFSMLSGNVWLLILTTCIFIALICVYDLWAKDKNKLYGIALAFIVGGAIGNFIDRIFLGGVRDFIFFGFWQTFPTFNVADCFLFIGTVLMVIYAIFVFRPKESKQEENSVVEKIENKKEETIKQSKTKEENIKKESKIKNNNNSKKSLNSNLEKNKKDDKVKIEENKTSVKRNNKWVKKKLL